MEKAKIITNGNVNLENIKVDTKDTETPEAKLRNQLSPIYGIVDLVLLIEENPEIIPILIKSAKQCIKNKEKITEILLEIENK